MGQSRQKNLEEEEEAGSGFFILRDADWFSWNNAAVSSKRVHLLTDRQLTKLTL